MASDVWFAASVTPDPAYQYFTWLAAGVIVLSVVLGAACVVHAYSNHAMVPPAPGWLEYLMLVVATTNLELLTLIPWVEENVAGLPSAWIAFMPTAGVIVEDLPQLLIQGGYLVVSGDTGNLVVLISVGFSGMGLILRFTRASIAATSQALDGEDDESEGDTEDDTSSDEEADLPERVEARNVRRRQLRMKKKQEAADSMGFVLSSLVGL